MAEGFRFVCDSCDRTIEAWSDGNPYYFDDDGKKQYAYHPDHDLLERCVGNDVPHLCLSCGKEFVVDSRKEGVPSCPKRKCKSAEVAEATDLEAKACPYCKAGVFHLDPSWRCIS